MAEQEQMWRHVVEYGSPYDGMTLRFWMTREEAERDVCQLILRQLEVVNKQGWEELDGARVVEMIEKGALHTAIQLFKSSLGYGRLDWIVSITEADIEMKPKSLATMEEVLERAKAKKR